MSRRALSLLLQANHIQEVCQASENMGKACEEKLVSKMENALRNREEQLRALQERLLEHVSTGTLFLFNIKRKR